MTGTKLAGARLRIPVMRNERHDGAIRWPVRAVIGLLATGSALAIGHVLAGATTATSSPFLAVGNTAVDLTPEPVKAFAIRQFGTADKIALLSGMSLVILVLALVAGLLARRSAVPGVGVIGLFGSVGIAAAVSRPDLGLLATLPSMAAAGTGIGVFAWLHVLARPDAVSETEQSGRTAAENRPPPDSDRRRFLVTSTAIGVAAGAAGIGGQVLTARSSVERARQNVRRLNPAQPPPEVPAGADFASAGTPTFITPNRDFYRIDTALSVPQVDVED